MGERGVEPAPGKARPAARARAEAAAPGDAVLLDLQSLLAAVVERLREATRHDPVAAWALREDGAPYIAAAAFTDRPPPAPDAAAFAELAALSGATDLTAPGTPRALQRLAARFGATAAAPIATREGHPLAVLLLGAVPAGGGPVRPRVLATLDAAARRLSAPLDAALAIGRFRALDTEVRRLDRLAALGALTAEIAHEVRNPLVSVKTFLQLLPERRDDPEFLTRFLEVANDELRRMERLLDLVIDHARPAATSAADPAARVDGVLASVAELLEHRAEKLGVYLETHLPSEPPVAAIDEDALRQVVLNLALNALSVTPSGGSVRLAGSDANGHVCIAVSDEGPGIPPELRSSVFEPFVSARRDRPGGLGLAISRRIVEEAGGAIAIEDAAGGGAVLRVSLPRATPASRG